MKKQVIITIILLIATAYVTIVYFRNLNPPGTRTTRVMHLIPADASLIFEFNNDSSFYDIFKDNRLFAAIAGNEALGQLDTLKQQLLQNPSLAPYFNGQNIFLSVHPAKTGDFELLITFISANGFSAALFDQASKQPGSGLVVTPMREGGRQGFNIYIRLLKRRFYVINKENNIFSGSFSKELIEQSAAYQSNTDKETFTLLPEQQSANSLANVYVNYGGLSPLFEQLLRNKNTDIFRSLKLLPALSALSLNYRTDALMLNGYTTMRQNTDAGYLAAFAGQKPVINHLKDIFPATTAYSTNLAISDGAKFRDALLKLQNKNGLKRERDKLLGQISAETGIKLTAGFDELLGNELAVVTTRYFEKIGIVALKDGTKLKTLFTAISTMTDEDTGQLNYDKLPLFLLGDAFSSFRRPCFTVIDNYLILADNPGELTSYRDTYLNRKFLSKNDQYNQFDNLLAGQSNVYFLFHFKNLLQIFERDMNAGAYKTLKTDPSGWKNFYAAAIQLSATDKGFYTNFCMKLSTDTVREP